MKKMTEVLTARTLLIRVVICLALCLVVMGVCTSVGTQKVSLSKVFDGPGGTPGSNIDYEIFNICVLFFPGI